MLVEGSIESGKDVTAGGALYNSSGVQGVGVRCGRLPWPALDEVVFQKKNKNGGGAQRALYNFEKAPMLKAELQKVPKFETITICRTATRISRQRFTTTPWAKHKNIAAGYVPDSTR